jgi:hypothetical protein
LPIGLHHRLYVDLRSASRDPRVDVGSEPEELCIGSASISGWLRGRLLPLCLRLLGFVGLPPLIEARRFGVL